MKAYKCPFCNKSYVEKEGLYTHIEEHHKDLLPKGMSPSQYIFNLRNKKTHGNCIMCGAKTGWNKNIEKYERLCSEKCKENYREQFKKRMMDKHGKVHLLDNPEQQKKMLANRKISGVYVWSDGTEFTYTGSYEKDFLEFLDTFMKFDSKDIMAPSPHTFYYNDDEGKKRFYIPDFFIVPFNLQIEVKYGPRNPNNHPKFKAVDERLEKLKDELMMSQKKFNYLKVRDKDYSGFLSYLLKLKEVN